jgi:hypothetical protein
MNKRPSMRALVAEMTGHFAGHFLFAISSRENSSLPSCAPWRRFEAAVAVAGFATDSQIKHNLDSGNVLIN